VNENTRRLIVVSGATLAIIGAFLVSAAYGADSGPYVPPPGCEASACPSHPDFLITGADELRFVGFAAAFSGVGILLAAAVLIEVPFTRVEEEALLEKIERTSRRLD